jgi:hypothetical protein
MRFHVLRLRHRGRPLPRHEWMNRAPACGDLRVEQVFEQELRRYLRVARILSVGRVKDPDEVPPLYEPVLVAMSPSAFSLTGFERVDGADFAQSWLVAAPGVFVRGARQGDRRPIP